MIKIISNRTPVFIKATIKAIQSLLFAVGRKETYSQFGEDAVLRAYFESKEFNTGQSIDHGFFVDIGAFEPKRFSNTYLFYKNGWTGINVDASPGTQKAFNLVRKRDINLQYAVGKSSEAVTFYCWSFPNVVNTTDREHAIKWTERIGKAPNEIEVQQKTLKEILDTYLPKDKTINFLSVDVEGRDLDVLKSNDWNKYKPEVVLVEDHDFTGLHFETKISEYMVSLGYVIYAWVRPTIIFVIDK
ncbi:MAG: FkbM family methyltransferase [Balneolales bacterium]|nr:FkbM family methyltransferase [Balneolales bacterium]